jgi:tRNA nucleotidyltransferase (CCA-adding enzyme)
MVAAGEADALVPERVWQEVSRGLMEKTPSRMIAVLRECGALARVLPELDESFERPDVPDLLAERLDRAAARGYGIAVRFALLLLDLDAQGASALAGRVNAPNECRDVALLAIAARELVKACDVDAESTLSLLERADAFRRPERLDRLLEVAECDTHVDSATFGPRTQLRRALEAARSVDAGKVAKENPADVAEAIRRARLVAIAGLQPSTGH